MKPSWPPSGMELPNLPYLFTSNLIPISSISTMGHPIAALIGQILLTAITAGFTHGDSPFRVLGLLPMALAVPYYVQTASSIPNLFQANFGGAQAVLALYQYLDVVLINKWDFRFHGPMPKAPEKKRETENGRSLPNNGPRNGGSFLQRLQFGFYAAASFRKSGTPFETHGVSPFKMSDPAYEPSSWRYTLGAALRFATCYLVLDSLTSLGDAEDLAVLFAEAKQPLFSRMHEMGPKDFAERVVTTVMFWTVLFLVLSTWIAFVSFLGVGLGLLSVSWWKPPFNVMAGHGFPYSIRRFWSHFWHKIVTDRIHQPSMFICDKVLRLRRGSLLRRYGTLALTFFFSMGFHAAGDIAGGIPPGKTGAPFFFFVQVLAIVAEDLVQWVWKTLFAASESATSPPAAWQKWVGRIWVFSFFVWSTPFFAYPMNLNNGDGLIVPFSVMRWIKAKL